MSVSKILTITLPIMFAYVFLGMALGILAASNNFTVYESLAIAFFVYSGSAEFLLIMFILAHEALFSIFAILFFLGFRHFFYTLTLLEDIRGLNFLRHYVMFALSDESFALLSAYRNDFLSVQNKMKRSFYYALLCFLNQSYWLSGVALGFLFQTSIDLDYSGIEFTLNALFVVLAYDAFKQNPNKKFLFLAILIGLCGFLFIPKAYMLFICLTIALACLLLSRSFSRG